MIEHLHLILLALGAPIVVFGIVELAHYPLALAADLRRRRPPVFDTSTPVVSVIVPAYNEERVVGSCVDSILADSYLRKEVILVDDGSSDETLAIMRRYEHHDNVIVLTQANRGKGAALNTGSTSPRARSAASSMPTASSPPTPSRSFSTASMTPRWEGSVATTSPSTWTATRPACLPS